MHAWGMAVFAAGILAAQPAPPRPFAPTAAIGRPYVIGEDPEDYGKIKVDYAKKYEVTLEAAELALRFPNRRDNVLAGANQKLLIFRGTARNLSKEREAVLSPGGMFGVRIWRPYAGPGEFKFVLGYNPETLQAYETKIPPGGAAKFIEVIEVPAGYEAMEVGLYFLNRQRIAWYDLKPVVKLASVFADEGGIKALPAANVAAGTSFDLDSLDIRVAGVERTAGGYAVDVDVTNRMLLPARWGWQYFTAELVGADGAAVRFYPEVIDRTTGRAWAGDLAAGASAAGRYTFTAAAAFVPRYLRLTSVATGRVIEAGLR
jgi:hypothetical protein